MSDIKIGDRVKIINTGKLYRSYINFALEYCDMSKWEDHRYPYEGDTFIVMNKARHLKGGRLILVIESENEPYQYLIGVNGVIMIADKFELELGDFLV